MKLLGLVAGDIRQSSASSASVNDESATSGCSYAEKLRTVGLKCRRKAEHAHKKGGHGYPVYW